VVEVDLLQRALAHLFKVREDLVVEDLLLGTLMEELEVQILEVEELLDLTT
tara:strand:+ start:362 stop:514 length:153 start_codon:yes stop_codon:yes gene_type:complete